MKYALHLAASMIALGLQADACAADRSPPSEHFVVEKIRVLEAERNQAILHGDATALERMASDDYTFITLRGELRTKAQIIRDFRAGSIKYESRQISDLNIRVYRNSAVVTGRATQKGTENGKDYSGDYWFTRVYVNQDGLWRTVALQTTRIQR